MDLYCLPDFQSPEEFLSLKAQRQGKFKKGGVVNLRAAAISLVADWNSGKIRYFTIPPEDSTSEVSSTIVNEMSKEFDLDSFCQMETDVLQNLPESYTSCPAVPVVSAGPVEAVMDQDSLPHSHLLPDNIAVQENLLAHEKRKKQKKRSDKKIELKEKIDQEMLLPGNERKANKLIKVQAKKKRKLGRRHEKAVQSMTGNLENFSL